MSDSLLDAALHYCRDALVDMADGPTRRNLRARLGVLERAAWSLALLPTSETQVVTVAKLVLDLRDDVARAAHFTSTSTVHFTPAMSTESVAEPSASAMALPSFTG